MWECQRIIISHSLLLTPNDDRLNGGMGLYYSTHKKRCPERDTCSSFSASCEALPDASGKVNHLIFSSEPLQGENIWIKMHPGELVGVAREMVIDHKRLNLIFL